MGRVEMWVCAKAFSSSANLGPGYDVLALAHDAYYDVVCVRKSEKTFVSRVTGAYEVPREGNNAIAAAEATLESLGADMGVEIWVHKGVPPGRGLGSSGATAAATVKAIELLLGKALDPNVAVRAAAEGERAATGSAHADNVAASYLGGLVMVMYNPLQVVQLGFPKVKFIVATPWFDVPEGKTGQARRVLPNEVSLSDLVTMTSGALAVVEGLKRGDSSLLARGLEMDPVVTPARSKLIPCYNEVYKAAKDAGALAVTISGAGPSIIILGDEGSAKAVIEKWKSCGIEASYKEVEVAKGASATTPPHV